MSLLLKAVSLALSGLVWLSVANPAYADALDDYLGTLTPKPSRSTAELVAREICKPGSGSISAYGTQWRCPNLLEAFRSENKRLAVIGADPATSDGAVNIDGGDPGNALMTGQRYRVSATCLDKALFDELAADPLANWVAEPSWIDTLFTDQYGAFILTAFIRKSDGTVSNYPLLNRVSGENTPNIADAALSTTEQQLLASLERRAFECTPGLSNRLLDFEFHGFQDQAQPIISLGFFAASARKPSGFVDNLVSVGNYVLSWLPNSPVTSLDEVKTVVSQAGVLLDSGQLVPLQFRSAELATAFDDLRVVYRGRPLFAISVDPLGSNFDIAMMEVAPENGPPDIEVLYDQLGLYLRASGHEEFAGSLAALMATMGALLESHEYADSALVTECRTKFPDRFKDGTGHTLTRVESAIIEFIFLTELQRRFPQISEFKLLHCFGPELGHRVVHSGLAKALGLSPDIDGYQDELQRRKREAEQIIYERWLAAEGQTTSIEAALFQFHNDPRSHLSSVTASINSAWIDKLLDDTLRREMCNQLWMAIGQINLGSTRDHWNQAVLFEKALRWAKYRAATREQLPKFREYIVYDCLDRPIVDLLYLSSPQVLTTRYATVMNDAPANRRVPVGEQRRKIFEDVRDNIVHDILLGEIKEADLVVDPISSFELLFDPEESEIVASQSDLELDGLGLRERFIKLSNTMRAAITETDGRRGHFGCYINRADEGQAEFGEVAFLFDMPGDANRLYYGKVTTFPGDPSRIKTLSIRNAEPALCTIVAKRMSTKRHRQSGKCGCGNRRAFEFWKSSRCGGITRQCE